MLRIKSFPVALYMTAKGQRLLEAELGLDGEAMFVFGESARTVMNEYHRDRERLSRIQAEVRRTGTTWKSEKLPDAHHAAQ